MSFMHGEENTSQSKSSSLGKELFYFLVWNPSYAHKCQNYDMDAVFIEIGSTKSWLHNMKMGSNVNETKVIT